MKLLRKTVMKENTTNLNIISALQSIHLMMKTKNFKLFFKYHCTGSTKKDRNKLENNYQTERRRPSNKTHIQG